MKVVETCGNYSIISYDENLVTIDFSDENVGVTIQSFESVQEAKKIFDVTVKTLSEHKANFHNTEVVKSIIDYKFA